jgi:hypothetical protein
VVEQRRPLARPIEVGEVVGVAERTLEQWRYRGIGPAYHRIEGRVMYDWRDVDAWLQAQRVEPAGDAA